jgi:hypothetical protein
LRRAARRLGSTVLAAIAQALRATGAEPREQVDGSGRASTSIERWRDGMVLKAR